MSNSKWAQCNCILYTTVYVYAYVCAYSTQYLIYVIYNSGRGVGGETGRSENHVNKVLIYKIFKRKLQPL